MVDVSVDSPFLVITARRPPAFLFSPNFMVKQYLNTLIQSSKKVTPLVLFLKYSVIEVT
jgi:hypothetical protein